MTRQKTNPKDKERWLKTQEKTMNKTDSKLLSRYPVNPAILVPRHIRKYPSEPFYEVYLTDKVSISLPGSLMHRIFPDSYSYEPHPIIALEKEWMRRMGGQTEMDAFCRFLAVSENTLRDIMKTYPIRYNTYHQSWATYFGQYIVEQREIKKHGSRY